MCEFEARQFKTIISEMNFSESSCSSFSLTDSESETEIIEKNNGDDEMGENGDDDTKMTIVNGATTEKGSNEASTTQKKVITNDTKFIDVSKKEEKEDSEKTKEQIVYR